MAALIEKYDWATSPVGPASGWSNALRGAVGLILPAQAEIVLFWGPQYVAFYNDAYAPTIGKRHPFALGRPAREGWAELWDDLQTLLAGVHETGKSFSDKDRPFHIDRQDFDEEVHFDISYSPVPDDDGSVGGVLCIVSETTELVRASRAIAEENTRLSQMFDQAPGFMAVLRLPGLVLELANASYLELIGNRDAVGRRVIDFFPEAEAQGFMALLDEVMATGRPHRGTGVALSRLASDGSLEETRFIDFVYQPIADASGKVSSIFVEGADVTDRVHGAERLVLSEESLRLATESAEIGTWDLDLRTDTLSWSERTKAMFGISPGVPCSMDDFYAGLFPDDLGSTTAAFQDALDPAIRGFYDVEYRTIGAEDGVIRWVAAKGRGVFDAAGICTRAIGTTIDVSARKETERALRESEQRFRVMADCAPALIWLIDANGDLIFINHWFEEIFGVSARQAGGDGWLEMFHPDDRNEFAAAFRRAFDARLPFARDARVIDHRGRVRWLQVDARPRDGDGGFSGYVGCSVDVTPVHLAGEALELGIAERTRELADANAALTAQIAERERVEATLHQMQRLEAVGQLTSGVAHDFNNLLTVVLGNVGMIEKSLRERETDDRTIRRIEHVRTAAERGATLTAQLLAFSRRQRLEAKAIDLNATVGGMRGLLESTLGAMVTIDTHLAEDLWPGLVDPTQIELIILNLAINARDAMPAGGRITIATANVTLGRPTAPEHPPAGDHVMVSLSDTGSGMSEAVLAKAFEPFFTTKDVGKGSGLGLAQVFGFAKQSGGGVAIDTRPGEGTTVRVYLPRTDAVPQIAAMAEVVTPPVVTDRRVLVIDDEEAVRAVTAEALAEIGCDVIETDGGEAALRLLADDATIELVLVDFAMPGMNGAEFVRRAQALRPDLEFLFVTGFADLDAIADVSREHIVQKPFDRRDLQARVGRLIER